MTLALGAVGLVYFALLLPGIVGQYEFIATWWTWPTLLLIFGLPVVTAGRAWRSSLRSLRLLAAIVAFGFLGAMLTLKLAATGGHLEMNLGTPWILGITTLSAIAAAIAWGPRFAWPYMALIMVLLWGNRVFLAPQPIFDLASKDTLVAVFMAVLFLSLALVSVSTAQALDLAAASAISEETRAATARAEARERRRAEALIHDAVLSTLLMAGRTSASTTGAAAIQARRALQQLEQLRDLPPTEKYLSSLAFVWLLQGTATDIAPQAHFSYSIETKLQIPSEVASAISEASAEALRNSTRHAGLHANRTMHVTVTAYCATVDIIDDGVGFDPATIPPSRLGIAISIAARVNNMVGGRARIVSQVDEGTRVFLEWNKR